MLPFGFFSPYKTFLTDDTQHSTSCSLLCRNQCLWMCWHWGNEVTWELTVFKAQQGCSHLALIHTHVHAFIHSFKNIHSNTCIQYTDAGEHWPLVWRFRGNGERERPGPVHTPRTLQTELADGEVEWRIILRFLAGSKASPDPRRDHPRWWHMWPGCTSYGDAGSAGSACPWSQLHSWHWAGPGGAETRHYEATNIWGMLCLD